MGCMGHRSMAGLTPALDRLADQGVLFTGAYCNSPICCPSRASMFSGRFSHRCQAWNNHTGLSQSDSTFVDRLDQSGYRVKILGKTGYESGGHTQRARVASWVRSAEIARPIFRMGRPQVIEADQWRVHERDWQRVDAAVDWLADEAQTANPFCLYLGTWAPHPEFRTSRYYLDRVDQATVELPPEDHASHPVLSYQQLSKNWMHGFDDEMVRLVRRIYFAMIAEVDAMVGQVVDAVDKAGLADSTYVILSSDHGELAMEHQQFYKMSMYEASVRVPLIIRGPAVAAGKREDSLVSLVDIYPTLMEMAAVAPPQAPEGLDGRSLLATMRGRSSEGRGWVLSQYHGDTCNTGVFMLREGQWKYVVYVGYEAQLFNLQKDPGEMENVAGQHPDKVGRMDTLLREIVDYEAVDASAKAYDRASFGQWRKEHIETGDYRELMGRIFSGWDGLAPGEGNAWTDQDEDMIRSWLGEVE